MEYQWKNKKVRGILPSVVRPHIMRDPPKSIHTRKKERVQTGDILYMLREQPDRYSEAIEVYSRGVNHGTGVNFNNWTRKNSRPRTGGHSSSTPGHYSGSSGQVGNPYKVGKDGAFRPPMRTLEDELPLSRQKRPNTSTRPTYKVPFTSAKAHQVKLDAVALAVAAQTNSGNPYLAEDSTSRQAYGLPETGECLQYQIRTNYHGPQADHVRLAHELDRTMAPYSVNSALSSEYREIARPNQPILDGRPSIAINTTPSASRHVDSSIRAVTLPDRLQYGGFHGKGSLALRQDVPLPNLTTKTKPVSQYGRFESFAPSAPDRTAPAMNLRNPVHSSVFA